MKIFRVEVTKRVVYNHYIEADSFYDSKEKGKKLLWHGTYAEIEPFVDDVDVTEVIEIV